MPREGREPVGREWPDSLKSRLIPVKPDDKAECVGPTSEHYFAK